MSRRQPWQVLLIAPVGTRDVTLTDLSLLPEESLRSRWNHAEATQRLGARRKGEILLADLDRYESALRMDILGKAVRHVFRAHGTIDRLVLVASNQPDETPERYRRNDTIEFARLIRELLRRDPDLRTVGEQTKIQTVTGNPASYETMREAYRRMLPVWCRDLSPDGVCYLEVTGGTAQMSAMLLLEGVRLLRSRAIPLYILKEYDMPQTLDLGRQILIDEFVRTLKKDLSIYAYHAAWQSAVEAAPVLRDAFPCYDTLVALLNAARHRLNFNFSQAQTALFGADRNLPSPLRSRVMALTQELSPEGRSREWLIAEVFHSAEVRFRTEAYASFVGRVFRFQEAMLRYLCESWGAEFSGKNDTLVDPGWLAERTNLQAAFEKAGISAERTVTRATLQVLALHLAHVRERGEEEWVKRLGRFEQVASLRNQLVITHGFSGVSSEKLSQCYRGGAQQIIADMKALLGQVLGVEGLDNPYDRLNALCEALLKGER